MYPQTNKGSWENTNRERDYNASALYTGNTTLCNTQYGTDPDQQFKTERPSMRKPTLLGHCHIAKFFFFLFFD